MNRRFQISGFPAEHAISKVALTNFRANKKPPNSLSNKLKSMAVLRLCRRCGVISLLTGH